ncbi:MAG TPA: ATPase, T2SS/T4P/T4SS family [Vicinamibacterales bacterium]|nr:ATPase, T2SS/T4P/T4SS family [Vicinamibacterales bacterium]
MALVDSLLTAMVRANGDALVMHVGEKPIVIAGERTIDLSAHGLNLTAMTGMLGQLLPADSQAALREFGAVEHALPALGADRFSVVAARGGDDIWIEIRRQRELVQDVGPVDVAVPVEPGASSQPEAPSEPSAPSAAEIPADTVADGTLGPPNEPVSRVGSDSPPEPIEAPPELPAPNPDCPHHVAAEMAPIVPHDDGSDGPQAEETIHDGEASETLPPSTAEDVLSAPVDRSAEKLEPPAPAVDELTVAEAETAEAAELASQASPAAAPEPVPVLALVRSQEYPAWELTTSMSSSEAVPQPTPPTGGPAASPPPSAVPLPVGEQPPVTRTVRIEVPSRVNPGRAARADQLLRAATTHDASELFLVSQSRPYIRAGGDIQVLADESVLQAADVDALLADLTPEPWRDAVRRGEPAEWLIELNGVGRVRCGSFRDHRGPGAVFRFVATQAASAEQLGLAPDAVLLATEPEGLVVVAGPAGSDRSAIVAAFVDIINQRRSDYIITIERQLRTLHENHHALVSQREAGTDDARLIAAVRGALRENPDVIVIEDADSTGLAALALDAAREERLVIVSIEATSAAAAVQRLIELLPAEARTAGRATLSRVFRGAIAQLLVRKATGGRVAAREQLSATREVSAVIREAEETDLAAALEARREGSPPLVDVLARYVRDGAVDVREAFRKAPDQDRLLAALRAEGVDTTPVDRLA